MPKKAKKEEVKQEASQSLKPLPMFEGTRVLEVLSFGDKFHTCKVVDDHGNLQTKHVPVELFK